jgi:Tfp pilus assembly protein PilN
MLRTNLSTRPFYNERVVHLLAALAAVIVVAITLMNVVKVVELSRRNTELSTRAARDRAEAQRLTTEAAGVRKGIDEAELKVVAAAAREANALIDQRTFSWTALFNHLEDTLPPDVMLVSVRPSLQNGVSRVSLVVLGRKTEDVDEFMEKLEATGVFEHVLPRNQERTDDGLLRQTLEADYVPSAEEATAPETSVPPDAEAPRQPARRAGGLP